MASFDIHPDIALASTPPTSFYLDPASFDACREQVFSSCWHFVGDTDQVKDPGWATPVTLLEDFLDEPLVLVRNREGALACLSNVCTHRGNLLVEKPCKLHDLRCRYHGRRFGLNGKLLSMPEFREVQNFPADSDHLTTLPTFTWGKWIFTAIRPAHPAEDIFRDMMARLHWLPLEEFRHRPDLSRDYEVDAHWALYCENYLEGFHIPYVHAGLNAVIDYGSYTTELYPHANLQLGLARHDDESVFDLPATSPDYGKRVAGYYFWIFPNLMFNFYPWGLSINVVKPITPSRTKVSFITYVWDENKLRQGAGANLHQVEMEDEAIVQLVQKGIRSRFYTRGRYSVNMERGTHHFHRLLTSYLR